MDQPYPTNATKGSTLHHPTVGSSLSFILPMDKHYPTNGSSSLSYQWINIVLPTDLHHHHPPDGSSLSSSYQRIIISIILSVDHY
ncbi:hypothetical protein KY290_017092 [Solanum tuberosum]|uniref:Uncharacterized protein n=1 Tax=Solanum tuberosum TaxID=4113 RepID=A0ABQ7VBZ3_SOLTU|nr:hypothetical protein KY290_017092 [Solanum tuberosum]